MAIYARFKANGTDLPGTAKNVKVKDKDLNGSTILQSCTYSTGYSGGMGGMGNQSYALGCTKQVDGSTPMLMQALDQNQQFEGEIFFTDFAEGAKGSSEEIYLHLKFTNGRVVSQNVGSPAGDRCLETLAFQYETLEVTHTKGNIVYVIEWGKRTA